MGHAGANGGSYGDLHCRVSIAEPQSQEESDTFLPVFQQKKDRYISLSEAVLGGRVDVDTAIGKKTLSIPPRTSSGKKVKNLGMPEKRVEI